jgi:hypothetical protein
MKNVMVTKDELKKIIREGIEKYQDEPIFERDKYAAALNNLAEKIGLKEYYEEPPYKDKIFFFNVMYCEVLKEYYPEDYEKEYSFLMPPI